MIAPHHREVSVGVGELALLDVFHPRLVHAYWIIVFCFARNRAGVATYTPSVVDYEPIIGNSIVLVENTREWDQLKTCWWKGEAGSQRNGMVFKGTIATMFGLSDKI